jgi:hypothetical protein
MEGEGGLTNVECFRDSRPGPCSRSDRVSLQTDMGSLIMPGSANFVAKVPNSEMALLVMIECGCSNH